jgi:hypothetical protein
MVRLGKYILFENENKLKEKFKATVDAGIGTTKPERKIFHMGQHSWKARCDYFSTLAEKYPLFNQSCLSLAGICTAQGVFTSPAVKKDDETYQLAEESRWRVEKLNTQERVTTKFYETIYRMAKYGGAFWEVTFTPSFGFRLAPFQECIEPATANEIGEITTWKQIINGTITAEWSAQPTEDTYLVHVPWNVSSTTWPYGTSLGVGNETELEALINMETNASAYMDKQAWPYEVFALGDEKSNVLESEYNQVRTEWKNRKPGDGFTTRNMNVDIKAGGTGSSPIRELATLCELMKDNLHDGLMVPPISKLENSTEASATVLTQHIMTTLGQPIQWVLKENYEEYVLKPYLAHIGFSVKSCPNILFESPDVHKKEEGEYWTGLVGAKIQTPQQACEHLGLEYDEAFWKQEELKQQQMFQQKQEQKEEQPRQPTQA